MSKIRKPIGKALGKTFGGDTSEGEGLCVGLAVLKIFE
jgi:hypothetical protein